MKTSSQATRGSILVFTIWVLTTLALFSAAVGFSVRQRLDALERLENRDELRSLAESGVKKAIYVLNFKKPSGKSADTLSDPWSVDPADFEGISLGRGTFSVSYQLGDTTYYGMTDEESKINLNLISSPDMLTRLFEFGAGLSGAEANVIASSILDWRDTDDAVSGFGAESSYYKSLPHKYLAKNYNFETLEELLFVKGVTPVIYEKILPFVTLNGSGKINVNTASKAILQAIGFSETLASKILWFREGNDHVPRTEDDRVFENLSKIADDLNEVRQLDDNERVDLQGLVESGVLFVSSSTFTIQSTARLNRRTSSFVIVCVVERSGLIKRWFEKFQAV